MAKKKVLLMGKAHSGKTSMRSIIFANYLARDTMRLSPTLDVEHHHVRFLGDLVLNLWDCGGQDAFYESYFERDRETIFRSVELLIYVFDIESDCPEKDFDHFSGVLEAIEENSPDARIFVLVHKMDLVAEEEREMILEDRRRLIEESCAGCGVQNFQCFGTSIWDETLYKAWSEIVTNLIPNIGVLESHLNDFCRICDADEVVLFERATFLVISHAQAKNVGGGGGDAIKPSDGVDGSSAAAIKDGSATGGAVVESAEAGIVSDVAAEDAGGAADGVMILDGQPSQSPPPAEISDDSDQLLQAGGVGGGSVGGAVDESAKDSIAAAGGGGGEGVVNDIAPSSDHPNTRQLQSSSDEEGKGRGGRGKDAPVFDAHRFEKISNIVKQFKLSCGKAQSQFQGMEVRNSRFSAFIDAFTTNTYIMVIVSHPGVHEAATLLNIKNARRHFERFIPRS
mmetsp:Transcript_5871/g.7613  ORF Transcript_5871/g.7613 Transcript_5871/m.7613 type:complete len:453 (-) Transcript_5871:324-1682(-)